MSGTIVEDFVKKFKEDYSLEEYQENTPLSDEDGLFMQYSLLTILNNNQNEQALKGDLFETVKALPKYAEYFAVPEKDEPADKNKLTEMINEFIAAPLQGNSGIAYSDTKSALKADNQIFREAVIEKTASTYGMDVQQIKQLLAPKLEEFLNNKFDYYKQALLNEHGLYSYFVAQK